VESLQLIIVSGFLGSGKTALVTALARQLVEKMQRRVMLVVNDVGEIGIDGQLMRRLGTDVYEIFGGCICCQLGSDLVTLLQEVAVQYPVDLILMEASGVAEPARIVDTVRRYGPPDLAVKVLALVDATRWLEMRPVLEPLLTGQVLSADWILVNKVDAAIPEVVTAVVDDIRSLNQPGEIIPLATSREEDVARVARIIRGE